MSLSKLFTGFGRSKNTLKVGTLRPVIPAVLVYIFEGDSVLMIHRNSGRTGDVHQGRWNGLGGKIEANESPTEAAIREVQEESGIDLSRANSNTSPVAKLVCHGVLLFPGFKFRPETGTKEDWLVYLFGADLLKESDRKLMSPTNTEGTLHWVKSDEVMRLNLWPGDRHFLPPILDAHARGDSQSSRPANEAGGILGTIWYEDGQVVRSELSKIGGLILPQSFRD